jgi:hypothetical protein
LDRFLLTGAPAKAELVASLLERPSAVPAAKPFYEGMRMLGPRTPDMALIALRLVLSGRHAEDESVVRLRGYVERARKGGPDGEAARDAFRAELA